MRRSGRVLVSLVLLAASLVVYPNVEAAVPGDNGWIAFARFDSGGATISVVDENGAAITTLANNNYSSRPQGGSWSPDGTRYAYTSLNNNAIRIENVQTHEETSIPIAGDNIDWSPDGSKFAFTQTPDGKNPEIFVVNADGTGLMRLTNLSKEDPGEEGSATDPAWSPDGTKIAFAGTKMVPNLRKGFDPERGIWTMDADGSRIIELFSDGDDTHYGNPDWSPDGTEIAFEHDDGSDIEVFVGEVARASDDDITAGGGTHPSFSPDGSDIVFEDGGNIYITRSAGGAKQTLQSCSGSFDCADPDWAPALPADCRANPDAVCGSKNDDNLVGTPGDDVIYAGDGNDTINGMGGNDTIIGGNGDDILIGGPGSDHLQGDIGNDVLVGDGGGWPSPMPRFGIVEARQTTGGFADFLDGGDGDDSLTGGKGPDELIGGTGLDSIVGGTGNDKVSAGDDKDVVSGGSGDDKILGQEGNDDLQGGVGNDTLNGGAAPVANKMNGGAGNDTCVRGTKKDKTKGCERTPLKPPPPAPEPTPTPAASLRI